MNRKVDINKIKAALMDFQRVCYEEKVPFLATVMTGTYDDDIHYETLGFTPRMLEINTKDSTFNNLLLLLLGDEFTVIHKKQDKQLLNEYDFDISQEEIDKVTEMLNDSESIINREDLDKVEAIPKKKDNRVLVKSGKRGRPRKVNPEDIETSQSETPENTKKNGEIVLEEIVEDTKTDIKEIIPPPVDDIEIVDEKPMVEASKKRGRPKKIDAKATEIAKNKKAK